jgi:predicted peptidase
MTTARLVSWAILASTAIAAVQGQEPKYPADRPSTGEFMARTHRSADRTMPYRLFTPKNYDPQRRYPLVLWLHGASGGGTDNAAQISGDQMPGTHTWTTPDRQARHPAFVLVPQTDSLWWVADRTSPELSPDLGVVVEILDAVASAFPIDLKRVYVLGQSMGGKGAWILASNKPERFAAAILLCPEPGNITRAAGVATLPIWIFQGDADGRRYLEGSRALVAALRAAKGQPRYTEYSHMGHDIWTHVFDEPELVPWLFAQRRQ